MIKIFEITKKYPKNEPKKNGSYNCLVGGCLNSKGTYTNDEKTGYWETYKNQVVTADKPREVFIKRYFIK